jgi:hypothetical protein
VSSEFFHWSVIYGDIVLRIIIGRSHFNTSSDAQLYAPYPFLPYSAPTPATLCKWLVIYSQMSFLPVLAGLHFE